MNIGIIGSGEMGTCLASKFVKQGHTVSMSNSRGPASLKQLTEDIGVKAVTIEEIVKNKQVIIVSIPQKNIPELPKNLFKYLPEDVVIVDTGNYYPTLRDGTIPALEKSGIDSLWVQEQLGVPVVKAFNSILAESIKNRSRPYGKKNRIAIAVSGDRPKAKGIIFKLVEELGFDPFNIGTITQSWKQQPGSPIYCRDITLNELKKRADALGTVWPEMQDIIIAKRETDEIVMKTDYPAYLIGLQN